MELRFAGYRRQTAEDREDVDEALAAQLDALAAYNQSPGWLYELVDARDELGTLRFRVAFFPVGEVVVFRGATAEMVASASQHVVRECASQEQFELWTALEGAYRTAEPPIDELIDFRQAIPEVVHPRLGVLRFDEVVWSGVTDGMQIGVDGLHQPDAGALARIAAIVDDAELATRLRERFGEATRLAGVWFEDGEEKLAYRVGRGAIEWCALEDV